jgi:hypothetical protein
MTIKTEKHRDGIFVFDRITVEPNQGKNHLDPAELLRALKSSALNLDHILTAYESAAKETLNGQGFKLKNTRKAYLSAEAKGLDAITVDLLMILFRAEEVRAAVASGDAAGAAWNTVILCRAAERAEIRPIEADIFRGLGTVAAASKGGFAKKEIDQARHDQWREDAEEIQKKHPSYKPWRIAGELAKRYEGDTELSKKRDTIYRVIITAL